MYLESQEQRFFSVLYRKYASRVFAKCYSILRDDDWAKDAVQEVFMKILLNLSTFGEKAQFSTWVYSITYNYCIDQIRKKKKSQKLFSDDEVERVGNNVADDEAPDEVLLELDTKQLQHILGTLPVGDRTILLMKYQDDMPIKDIAETLDKTESAIKMKIKRAKQKAQEMLKETRNPE